MRKFKKGTKKGWEFAYAWLAKGWGDPRQSGLLWQKRKLAQGADRQAS
jgi:hypothetical protein